jgi:hypothetical protein
VGKRENLWMETGEEILTDPHLIFYVDKKMIRKRVSALSC